MCCEPNMSEKEMNDAIKSGKNKTCPDCGTTLYYIKNEDDWFPENCGYSPQVCDTCGYSPCDGSC